MYYFINIPDLFKESGAYPGEPFTIPGDEGHGLISFDITGNNHRIGLRSFKPYRQTEFFSKFFIILACKVIAIAVK